MLGEKGRTRQPLGLALERAPAGLDALPNTREWLSTAGNQPEETNKEGGWD